MNLLSRMLSIACLAGIARWVSRGDSGPMDYITVIVECFAAATFWELADKLRDN